jgi:hypothetical protein
MKGELHFGSGVPFDVLSQHLGERGNAYTLGLETLQHIHLLQFQTIYIQAGI